MDLLGRRKAKKNNQPSSKAEKTRIEVANDIEYAESWYQRRHSVLRKYFFDNGLYHENRDPATEEKYNAHARDHVSIDERLFQLDKPTHSVSPTLVRSFARLYASGEKPKTPDELAESERRAFIEVLGLQIIEEVGENSHGRISNANGNFIINKSMRGNTGSITINRFPAGENFAAYEPVVLSNEYYTLNLRGEFVAITSHQTGSKNPAVIPDMHQAFNILALADEMFPAIDLQDRADVAV